MNVVKAVVRNRNVIRRVIEAIGNGIVVPDMNSIVSDIREGVVRDIAGVESTLKLNAASTPIALPAIGARRVQFVEGHVLMAAHPHFGERVVLDLDVDSNADGFHAHAAALENIQNVIIREGDSLNYMAWVAGSVVTRTP